MKRSNRLILLIGVVLAIVVGVGIFFVLQNGTAQTAPPPITTATFVVALQDIPIGTAITKEMVAAKEVPKGTEPADSFPIPEAVIGKIVRADVKKDSYISPDTLSGASSQFNLTTVLQPGYRAMAIPVDDISGVDELIKPGDRVDVVLGLDKFPVVPVVTGSSPAPNGGDTSNVTNISSNLSSTSVKSVIENVLVVTTSTSIAAAAGPQASPTPATGSAATGTAAGQVVILAVTAQESEVIRFAEIDGTITLVLRSPADASAPPDETTGITLRKLVDAWGILPPQIVQTLLPK